MSATDTIKYTCEEEILWHPKKITTAKTITYKHLPSFDLKYVFYSDFPISYSFGLFKRKKQIRSNIYTYIFLQVTVLNKNFFFFRFIK